LDVVAESFYQNLSLMQTRRVMLFVSIVTKQGTLHNIFHK